MIVKTSKPKAVWKAKTLLGEGILWVPSHKTIYFVDIKKKNILIFNLKSKIKKIIKIDKEIGFISHIKNSIFLLGLKAELRIMNIKNKKILKSIKIEDKKPLNRINDGKTDPKGRLWFGTMDNLERKVKNGSLYCLDKKLKLHKVDSKYYIPNGPAFLSANIMLHADSRKKIIYKIKIDKNYKIIKKSKFIKFYRKEGSPDGMTVDSKKNVWVCHYGAGCISVYNPSGKKVHIIYFSAKNITNCTFGGYDNKELFITTARKDLKRKEMAKYPDSGSLFKIKTNLKGKKALSFKLSNLAI